MNENIQDLCSQIEDKGAAIRILLGLFEGVTEDELDELFDEDGLYTLPKDYQPRAIEVLQRIIYKQNN